MREHCKCVLKGFFHTYLVETRASLSLTQAKMAQRLAMDERSYTDLDHGKSLCSATTLVLFLLYCCADPMEFLNQLRAELESEANHVA